MKLKASCLILLYAFLKGVYTFVPKLQLKNIIATRALYTSIVEKFSFDVMDETLLTQITTGFDVHNMHPLYFASILYAGYLMKPDNTKLENFEAYIKSKQITRQMVLIFFIIFMKNVDSAT